MRVLLLTPYAPVLTHIFAATGDDVTVSDLPMTEIPETDFIVSYGYRHLVRPPVVKAFERRMVNLHISTLPFNRGADPNFWSWFDDTPKGVSIHWIDQGLDTGNLLAQKPKRWPDIARTLRSTYDDLQTDVVKIFDSIWPALRIDRVPSAPQMPGGTYHRARDKEQYFSQLSRGWDSPVSEVAELGRKVRETQKEANAEAHMTAGFFNAYDKDQER